MSRPEKKLVECFMKRKALFVVRDSVEVFINNFDNQNDVFQIPIRVEALDRVYNEFIDLQTEIEKYDDPEKFEEHMQERATFEARYCSAKANHPPANFHLRLPKIDLPKFDGDLSRWLSFRDTFTSMVHSNADIPTVAKMQYLLQSLEGEAHKPFESTDISADNYTLTWDALLKRYDNKRYLKRQLFRALYDLPPLNKESPQELHDLVDDYQRHVKALAKLNEPVIHWDTPLINLLSYKLDSTTLRAWEEKTSSADDITYEELVDFLYQRVRMLKSVVTDLQQRSNQVGQVKVAGSTPNQKKPFKMKTICYSNVQHFPRCPFVNAENWYPKNAYAGIVSVLDTKRHHTLLHESAVPKVQSTPVVMSGQSSQQPNPPTLTVVESPGSANPNPQVSLSAQSYQSTVLLETVNLLVVDQNGKEHPARALLDSGSMCSFITKKLSNVLNLRRTKVDIAVSGIGEASKQIKRKLTATIKSKLLSYSTTLDFLILKKPTVCLPTTPIDISSWQFPDVPLADPRFHIPADVDMIVGGEVYYDLHTGCKISCGEGKPVFVETSFGWTVSGKVVIQSPDVPRVCHLTTVDRNLEQALQKFWELEAVEPCSMLSAEENFCEDQYATTTTRDSSGRYRRFLNLEKRLERDPTTKAAYCRFMEEYERLNHMKKLVDPVDETKPHCFLPHHPVFKESSTTTKVRCILQDVFWILCE
ncbi:uncharacterized protein LOC129773098 [Toxorhynchites rutilus septentrionalis]|uniref:uncharacterized protein LOC129773098 n=1 Tax=Toxorhynchites rutilus septentrionalis TaxID=329112 RepID=UPI0024798FAB|nr:uncharacterized protein LOC129773098 [Toxorhynchites rutilus septentrionalis]